VIALYLILGGQRFRAAIPLKEELMRRSGAGYVSMADLFQRGGKRGTF
jgi:hypothetical protein